MLRSRADPPSCQSIHDVPTLILSLGLCLGMVISYLPQHLRIICTRSSEGFSPLYLLLGATSSASGMLNMLIVQWPLFRCCRVLSVGRCFESLLGFYQVTLQWLLFIITLILYLTYFPAHLKYQRTLPILSSPRSAYGSLHDAGDQQDVLPGEANVAEGTINGITQHVKATVTTTPAWRLAVTLAIVVALHVSLLFVLSLSLLLYLPIQAPPHPILRSLAIFLGISATILGVLQYAPQIYKTYRSRLVGALSVGTMKIQVPGSVLFVLSLVGREGTDWTSWLAFAVTGGMQGALLTICLLWKRRQNTLGIDDFGNSLEGAVRDGEQSPLVADR